MHMQRENGAFQQSGCRAAAGDGCDPLERIARARAGDDWQALRREAIALAQRLRFLPWEDRARVLDQYCWERAQQQLSLEEITGIVNRQARYLRDTPAVSRYADHASGTVAAALMALGESGNISSHTTALVHLVSGEPELQAPALAWLAAAGSEGLRSVMAQLPGFAFLFLILYPNDSAESFMARDAFFAAMLGR